VCARVYPGFWQVALAVSAAQALHVFTEENAHVCGAIAGSPPMLGTLKGAVSSENTPTMVGVLAVGVLINLGVQAQAPELAPEFARILGTALDSAHCSTALNIIPQIEAQAQAHEAQVQAQLAAEEGSEAAAHQDAAEAGAAGGGGGGMAGVEGAEGMNRKQRRHAAKGLAPGHAGVEGAQGGGSVRAVTHGDFKEAFLHTEGQASVAIAALSAWKDGVMVSQVALQMMANMLASQDEDEEDDNEGWEEEEEGVESEHGAEGAGSGWMEDAEARPVPGEMAAWMASSGLLQRVGQHCHVPFELSHSQLAHTRSGPSDVCPALADLQVTALDCLCNWMAAAPPGSEETLVGIRDGVLVAGAAASVRLPTPLRGTLPQTYSLQ